jgi:hypothetical protein
MIHKPLAIQILMLVLAVFVSFCSLLVALAPRAVSRILSSDGKPRKPISWTTRAYSALCCIILALLCYDTLQQILATRKGW